jgi:glyceraldehyde-3-phosphate dehydrogenase (NADP+)
MMRVGAPQALQALWVAPRSISAGMRAPRQVQQRYLVGGELRAWTGACRDVLSPIKCMEGAAAVPVRLGSFALLDRAACLEILAAAVAAYADGQGAWPAMTAAQRIACVEHFTQLMLARRAEVVRWIMWEIAKPLADCEKEFDRSVAYVRATIQALKDLEEDSARMLCVEGTLGQIRRCALGVVLCMGPYNYPLNETFTTLIPALLMGNTVVLKPPRLGVLCYGPLLEAFQQAFPAGVVNTLYGMGEDVVPPLMESGAINVLAFIGSSRVADKIKRLHPRSHRLRSVLGLDAKNPAIVLEDADLDLTVKECLAGALSFNGQRCTALKILFVHRAIAADFVQRLAQAVADLCMGMPWEPGVQITPLADVGHLTTLNACLQDALAKGAKVLNPGGGQASDNLFRPAVVYPVVDGMRLYSEEQFGPIVPVVAFDDVASVVAYVQASDFGQQISLFGHNPLTLGPLVDALVSQVCRVNLNCQCQRSPDAFPFTGRKDSAEGTLSVVDALRAFSIRSMVAAKQTPATQALLKAMAQGGHSQFVTAIDQNSDGPASANS